MSETLPLTHPSRRPDLVAALVLFALAAIAVGPGLLPGRTVLPADVLGLFEPWRLEWPRPDNPILGDPVMEFSARVAVAKAWRSGHPPLWNPAVMSGHPLIADSITAPFYALQALPALLLDDQHALALQILLQLWLAGVFMYAWLRRLLGDRPLNSDPSVFGPSDARPSVAVVGILPALVGAIVWQLAGYQQVWLAYPYFLGTLLWLPLIAWGWETYAQRGGRRALAASSFGLGMAILGGQLEFVALGGIVIGLYGLGRLLGWGWTWRRRAIIGGAVIAVLGVLVGSVALLPELDQAREFWRAPFSSATIADTGIGAAGLAALVTPWPWGHPMTGGYHHPAGINASEAAVYVGLLPLAFMLFCGLMRPTRRLLGLLGLGAFVLAMATGSALGRLQAAVPLFNQFGLMRWLAMWPLVAAAATAASLHPLWTRLTEPANHPRRARWVAVWLVCLTGADLLAAYWGYTPSAPLDQAYPAMPPLDQLVAERQGEPFRIAAVQTGAIALGPAVAPSLGLDEIGGYSSFVRQSYRAFIARLAAPPDNDDLKANVNMITVGAVNPVLPQLLNVRYLLSAEPLNPFVSPIQAVGDCHRVRLLRAFDISTRTVVANTDDFNHLDVPVWGEEPLGISIYETGSGEPTPEQQVAGGSLEPVPGSVRWPDAPVVDEGSRSYIDSPPGPLPPQRTFYFPRQDHSKGRRYRISVLLGRGPGTLGFPNVEFISRVRGAVCEDHEGLQLAAWAEHDYEQVASASGLVVQRPLRPPLGRAWWVEEAVTVTGQTAALARVAEDGFDPAKVVVLEAASQPVTPSRPPQATETDPRPRVGRVVSVADDGPNALRIDVASPDPGWLVLSEAYAPGWSATVDGRPAEVYRADGGIRAVALPAGARAVALTYRPASLVWGLALTLVGVLNLGLLLIRHHRPPP